MTWAGITATEWVSYTAAQTSGITQITALPTSDQWMTKSAVATYLNINTAWASLAAKSSSQWVAKQDLHEQFAHSGTFYYANYDVGHNSAYGGFASAGAACTHSGALTKTVYWNGTIGNGTVLYNADGSVIVAANTTDYFYIGGYSFTSSTSGYPNQLAIANYASCGGTTYTINLYATQSATSGLKRLWYRINSGTWTNTSNNVPSGSGILAATITVASGDLVEAVISDNINGPGTTYMTTTINTINTTTYAYANFPATATGCAISGYTAGGNKDMYCTGNTPNYGAC